MSNFQDDWYTDNSKQYSQDHGFNYGYGNIEGDISGAMNGAGNGSGFGGYNQGFTSHGFDTPQPQRTSGFMEDEPPLLEELGINFNHIYSKTLNVINPRKEISQEVLEDSDWAGPFVFCVAQGVCLLFSGKLHFGYLFGFGIVGCFLINTVLNLMNQNAGIRGPNALDSYKTVSILGYSLLPIVFLSFISITARLGDGPIGLFFALLCTLWSTITATRFFEKSLNMSAQRYLIAYPVLLFYVSFALITVF